jgi:hypothetical protein
VAGVWEVLRAVGLGASRFAVPGLKLFFALVGVATAGATWRLARASGASPLAAALGAGAFALAAPALYFAPRAMSETACALPATLGLAFALDPESGRRRRLFGAALLVVSVFLRLQCGLFCVGLLAILAARTRRSAERRWRPLLETTAVLVAGAVLFGLFDRLTWGSWFHSALVYLRFNLVEGKASGWGTEGAFYYVAHLFTAMPLLTVAALALACLGVARAKGLALLALAFLLLHSAIPHKELRFIFPLLPLGFALAGLGVDRLEGSARRWGVLALALPAAVSAGGYHRLTFGELGAYPGRRGASAYDDFGPVNRLLLQAGAQPDLCGLFVSAHLAWTGGYTYLHREVPLYGGGRSPPSTRSFNYAIVDATQAAAAQLHAVSQDGTFALVRRFDGPCEPDPSYSWRLP